MRTYVPPWVGGSVQVTTAAWFARQYGSQYGSLAPL
jgi:hypothetical protein